MPLAGLIKGDVNQQVLLLQRFLVLKGFLNQTVVDRALGHILEVDFSGAERRKNRPLQRSMEQYLVHGVFDQGTEVAVCRLQEASGLPVNGKVDSATWAAIANVAVEPEVIDSPALLSRNLPLLRMGDRDSIVVVLQRLLLEYSRTPQMGVLLVEPRLLEPVDIEMSLDHFTTKTAIAVKSFQKRVGTVIMDGEVGSETWAMLIFPRIEAESDFASSLRPQHQYLRLLNFPNAVGMQTN